MGGVVNFSKKLFSLDKKIMKANGPVVFSQHGFCS
jgi:hypothetical protein